MNNAAVAKIEMLKGSLRCFTYGLLGFLPTIGIPFAIMAVASREGEPRLFCGFCFCIASLSMAGLPFALVALVISTKVYFRERKLWNAARSYRMWGGLCAMLGVLSSFVVGALTIFLISNSSVFGN